MPRWRVKKRCDLFFIAFFNVHIMNVNYTKLLKKKFDSRTISGELPQKPFNGLANYKPDYFDIHNI